MTGHSLGAALAHLAAADIFAQCQISAISYTFAGPRAGDPAFAAAFIHAGLLVAGLCVAALWSRGILRTRRKREIYFFGYIANYRDGAEFLQAANQGVLADFSSPVRNALIQYWLCDT